MCIGPVCTALLPWSFGPAALLLGLLRWCTALPLLCRCAYSLPLLVYCCAWPVALGAMLPCLRRCCSHCCAPFPVLLVLCLRSACALLCLRSAYTLLLYSAAALFSCCSACSATLLAVLLFCSSFSAAPFPALLCLFALLALLPLCTLRALHTLKAPRTAADFAKTTDRRYGRPKGGEVGDRGK